jgi:hypothetical protein
MNDINEDVSREIQSAADDETAFVDAAQLPVSINREGSGHTFNVNDTIGVVVVGLISLVLLLSLLRSEARYRKLIEQTRLSH